MYISDVGTSWACLSFDSVDLLVGQVFNGVWPYLDAITGNIEGKFVVLFSHPHVDDLHIDRTRF